MTPTRSEIVEAMARKIHWPEHDESAADGWNEYAADARAKALRQASAALTALLAKLGECGWKVVPVEATEGMRSTFSGDAGDFHQEDWSAMIAAAPDLLQDTTP